MKVPEFVFPLINRIMALFLASPIHGLMSNSIMVIYFQGRKSGKARQTPVRYLRDGDQVLCMTGRETGWWHNFVEPAAVRLRLGGEQISATANVNSEDRQLVAQTLDRFLAAFPQDAVYHNITLNKDGSVPPDQYAAAVANDVVVTFQLAS